MAQYMAKVNEIAAAEGISTNPMNKVPLMVLENEIANLEAENAAKRELLKVLDERLELAQAELKAEQELSNRYQGIVIDDLDSITQKNHVLSQYIATLESGDEFRINKLAQKVEDHLAKFYDDNKQIIEKARAFNAELSDLRELQKKCDELREKTSQLEN